jgi:Flp pilus assembly protein TadG
VRELALGRTLRGRSRAQALIEFAFLAPVMMLLILGMIDLGRGFYYQTELTDAARDAARVLIAPGTGSDPGPGWTAGCNAAERDLTNVGIANVSCQQWTGAVPFTYSTPPANQATVYVYCGTSSDCATAPAVGSGLATTCDNQNSPHTCVEVGVAYTFSILSFQIKQIAGPTLLLTDSGSMVTLW